MADNCESTMDMCIEEMKRLCVNNETTTKADDILDYFGIKLKPEDEAALENWVKMNDADDDFHEHEKKSLITELITEIKNQSSQSEHHIADNENYISFLEKECVDYSTYCHQLNNYVEQYNLSHQVKVCNTDIQTDSPIEEDEEIIRNLNRLREIINENKNLQQSIEDVKAALKPYKNFPPNIDEAKRKLKNLKNEYERECDKFYKKMWKGDEK